MCGIMGYVGRESAAEKVFEGLTILEYRGYDSSGICTIYNGKLTCCKRAGRVESLRPYLNGIGGTVGIGHTRWATHGKPTDINAHPHVAGKFAVVHNGIIENYVKLKGELQGAGARFVSDTDSEVIAWLLNFYYDGDLLLAVKQTAERLEGSYALAILCQDYDGICAVKCKSPLIVGYGDGENFVASDIPALGYKADRVSVLQDGDIALITAKGVTIYDGSLRFAEREKSAVKAEESNVKLFGCPHYMLKEIRENATALTNTVDGFFSADLATLKGYVSGADKIVLVGCGTAYNAALAAKYWLDGACSCPCEVCVAGEARYFPPKVTGKTLVIAVSQSGETADTLGACRVLKDMGAKVVAITNVCYSAITRLADISVCMRAGVEICVAATKSYVCQLACLYLIRGLVCGESDCGKSSLLAACFSLESMSRAESLAGKIADVCAESSAVFFLGRGIDYAAAVEGSLKLKEVSYVFSDAYPAGELKHGTLALVDDKTLSIVIITIADLAQKCESVVEQILSRGGRVVVVTNLKSVVERLDKKVDVAFVGDERLPIFPCAALLQLIAYKTAVKLNRNPDRPRNLAKSVTVE